MAFTKQEKLIEWGNAVGRVGLSEAALDAVEKCDMSYKGVMQLAGSLKAIAIAAEDDVYWFEQVNRGFHEQLGKAEHRTHPNPMNMLPEGGE